MTHSEIKYTIIGELAEVKGGKRLRKGKRVQDKVTAHPYLRVVDFREDGFDPSNVKYITEEAYRDVARYTISHNDIYISIAGTIGRVGIVPPSFSNANLTENAAKITNIGRNFDKMFLMYYLRSDLGQADISSKIVGTSQPKLALFRIKEIQVPQFPLPTQRKIASILSAYDDLIENNLRRIKILEEMAQSLYREWFVKFRFPGHEKVRMVDSELGKIPEGWEVKPLKELCSHVEYGYTAKAHQEPVGSKFLRITDIVPSLIDWENVPFCAIPDSKKTKYLLAEGDIVIARTGATVGYAKRIESKAPESIFASYLVRVRIQSKYDNNFIGLILESRDYKLFVKANMSGAAQPNANAQVLTSLLILVPTDEIRDRFKKIISTFFVQRAVLRTKNATLRRTRDILLPRLISGELDVSNLNIEIPANVGNVTTDTTHKITDTETPSSGDTATEKGEDSSDTSPQEETKTDDQDTRETTEAGPTPIDEWESEEIMATFRKAARRKSVMERDELIGEVSQFFGYRRLGPHIREALKGHLRAAIRRHIIGADGDTVWLETPKAEAYERDELIATLISVMQKNREYDREDVIYAVARHLGFERMRETVTSPIRSAINGAIRRGILSYQDNIIWRED